MVYSVATLFGHQIWTPDLSNVALLKKKKNNVYISFFKKIRVLDTRKPGRYNIFFWKRQYIVKLRTKDYNPNIYL